jgi:cytochrome P450
MTDIDYSLTAPHVLTDPAAAYRELRSRCPVHFEETSDYSLFTVAGLDAVMDILLHPDQWSNAKGPGVKKSSSVGDVQHDDPPVHTKRRRFLRDPFLPSAVNRTAALIRHTAESLADGLLASGATGCELNHDFALALPVASFCALLGVDLDDREQFSRWADDMVAGMAYQDAGREGRAGINRFAREQIEARRALHAARQELPEGFLSYVATAPYDSDGSPMPIDEAVNTVSQFLVAGHETTTSLITNLLWRVLETPSLWQQLVADPSLIEGAIEESLRFDPPVLGLCRTSTAPANVQGVDIPEDAKVMVLYASANRDPTLFPNPDEFRLDRALTDTKKHLSFSWGIHYCLGAGLARLTGRIAVETLVSRFPSMRLAGPTKRLDAPFLWGRKVLPVAWN